MSEGAQAEARRSRARAGEEEVRYRAAAELDPGDPADLDVLQALLADASWRVRSAAVDRLAGAADPRPALPVLLAALTSGATIGARDAAASALVRIGGPATEPLLAALSADDPDLRLAAAAVLGDSRDRRAAAPLAARLADVDPNVRAAAAEALGKIGGPDAAATLLAALDSDDATLKLAALEALAALRICPPVARVEPLLADRVLRRPAYRALGASDEPGALPLLARGLSEPARGARSAALAGIGMQRARRPAADLGVIEREARAAAARDGGIADACAAALGADEPFVVVGALTVLGWVGDHRHLAAMLRLAEDDRLRPLADDALRRLPEGKISKTALAAVLGEQGPFGRIITLAALARMGSPAALESLIREASDPDAHVQGEAIAALGKLGDARAVAPLAGLLGDEAGPAAGRAADALVEIGRGDPGARAAALAVLRDRAEASPSSALLRVLGALGGDDDVPRLEAALRAPSVAHRTAAAAAVGLLGERGVLRGRHVAGLVAALSDPAWVVRAAAARSFQALALAAADLRDGDPLLGEHPLCHRALGALGDALRDVEPVVRAAAAEALGACGRQESAPALRALLDAPDAPPAVAVAALRGLAALGPPTLEIVARAAAHGDPEVVKEAVLLAALVAGSEAERLLCDAAASRRWDVRQAAARAFALRGDPALADAAARCAAADPDPLVARAFAEAAQGLGRGPRA